MEERSLFDFSLTSKNKEDNNVRTSQLGRRQSFTFKELLSPALVSQRLRKKTKKIKKSSLVEKKDNTSQTKQGTSGKKKTDEENHNGSMSMEAKELDKYSDILNQLED